MFDVGKMVDAVLDAVDKPLRAFAERLKALEARTPEKGEPGRDGIDGKHGIDGKDGFVGPKGDAGPQGLPGEQGRDGRDGLPGLQGEKGIDGKDGVDGLGFDSIEGIDDAEEYGFCLKQDGAVVREFRFAKPRANLADFYKGVWREAEFKRGDAVTCGGSLFIAQCDTTAKPESGADWKLAVKRGRDGKDGKQGERGAKGEAGSQGPRGDRAFGI